MCDVCEGRVPIKAEIQMKLCSIENYVVGMESKILKMSVIVQEAHRPPFNVQISFECNYCPKCGREIKQTNI